MGLFSAEQSRLYKRSKTAETFLEESKARYAMLKPFEEQVNLLIANNKKIDSYMPDKSGNGEGATTEKGNLKLTVAEQVNAICTLVVVYAAVKEDAILYNAVNFTTSDVTKMRDPEVNGFVIALVSVVTPLLSLPDFATYPVTQEQLTQLSANATDFNDSLGTGKMIDSNSSVASKNISALLRSNGEIIEKLSKLINFFKTSDPDFYANYHTAVAIDKTGIHHSGISGVIKNIATGQPVYKAVITGEGKDKIVKTDKEGSYELIKIRAGLRTFAFAAPGYETQTITLRIIRGKIEELNIELQAQAMTMSATA